MSRNKENNPLQSRAVGSVFSGKQPTPPSAEFFTDSLLEDTSRIPSPSPLKNKNAASNPRRAQRSSKSSHVSKGLGNTARQPTSLQNAASRGTRHQQPAPTLQRPLSLRSSNSDLITPPQSRDGPESIKSPMSVESVPSHDLTDTYQRIYDEEELAANERESGSSDDDREEMEYAAQAESPSRAPRASSIRNSHVDLRSIRSTTPEAFPADADKENVVDENTGTFSQGSGMSFLAQLTDKDLAAKMTPHMSERARDMRRLQPGISTRPISFHAGTKPSEFIAEDVRSNASSDRSSRSSRRRNLQFNSTGSRGVAKAHSDTSVEIRSRASPTAERKASSQPTRLRSPIGAREPLQPLEIPGLGEEQMTEEVQQEEFSDDEGEETSAELKARERQFELNRARKVFGIPTSKPVAGGVSDANAAGTFSAPQRQTTQGDDLDEDDGAAGSDHFTQSSVRSNGSQRSESSVLRLQVMNKVPATNKAILKKWARTAAEQRTARRSNASEVDSSQVDWLGAAADAALPTVEQDGNETKSDDLAPLRQRPSIDRMKRIESETTGLSFQVSESPPVKTRKSFDDILREKEIDQLSRQAVTKSRLDAIRERDPREAHRRLSRSPSGSSLRQSQSNEAARPSAAELEVVGEHIPDTPVVVFRSSSGSSRSTGNGTDRPGHDRRKSHDALQRFARLSATPKSSPSITPKFEPSKRQTEAEAGREQVGGEHVRPKTAPIAATPRVTGAWTDTILPPGTVGTVKPKPQPKYVQTPHVKPGGWVDTPVAAPSERPRSAPEPIDEITEDLTTDVGPKLDTAIEPQDAAATDAQQRLPCLLTGQSALSNILAVQRARIASAPAATGGADDTLNLGEATMASLEDLVNLNEEDVTTLIRLGAEQDALQQLGGDLTLAEGDHKEAEIVVLDRLTKKLNTLQANIRHARRAVGRFEREMSEGIADDAAAPQSTTQAISTQQQQAQHHPPPQTALIRGTGVFPILYSTLTLPLPLLFQPTPTPTKNPNKRRSGIAKYLGPSRLPGKPTPLLYFLLCLLAYYILEVLLSEIYAHPLYAETYSWPTPPSTAAFASPLANGGVAPASSSGFGFGSASSQEQPWQRQRQVPAAAIGHARGEPEFGLVLPTLLARMLGGDVDGGKVKGCVMGVLDGVVVLGTAVGRAVEMGLGWGDGFAFAGDDDGDAAQADRGAGGMRTGRGSEAGGAGGGGGEGWSIMNDEVL